MRVTPKRKLVQMHWLAWAVIVAPAFVYPIASGSVIEAHDGSPAIGERVVLRSGASVLRVDGRNVPRSRQENHYYRIEAVDGATARLKAEGDWIVGFIPASEVVPVARGVEYFTTLIGSDPKNAYAFLMRSVLRLDRSEFEPALADADQAARLGPRDSRVYSGRGQIRLGRREYVKAIQDFNEAIRLNPSDAIAYRGRAACWSERGDFENAVADLNVAIRLAPEDVSAYRSRGVAWKELRRQDEAIADFSQVLRLDPEDVAACNDRGLAWSAKKDFDMALASYNQALRLDPRSVITLKNRGSCWLNKHDGDRAVHDFETALEIDPKDLEARRLLGQALSELFTNIDREKVIQYAMELCNAKYWKPGPADAQLIYGLRLRIYAYDSSLKHRAAIPLATTLCEISKWKDDHALLELATAYREAGDFATALKWATKAAEFAPEGFKSMYESTVEAYRKEAAAKKKS
jgi:tetratricopeptide (TPR) repeat protein